MPDPTTQAARRLEIPAELTFEFGVGTESPNSLFKGVFLSIAGPLRVDSRCRKCDTALPLPPSRGRWSDVQGKAPQSVVWTLLSARLGGGVHRGAKHAPGQDGVIGTQGENPNVKPDPIILHFEETPEGLKWHWFCRGEKDGAPCGASPTTYASYFDQWVGDQARRFWPNGLTEWPEGAKSLSE